ncbi:MAG: hypothetical protein HZC17_00285 [Candidatus Omnitrophica bacterium]|nr:hypothetical protein [Candidatus Omnitrophota bacterium]
MNRFKIGLFLLAPIFFGLVFSGCEKTYNAENVADSIKEICKKEYNINNVEVKITGNTIGVHLPLRQLFSSDFEHVLATGKVQNLESLLQFSPEAMDKVEDVLFSMSRVILSTGRPIDFYVLKASDTEVTGIELVLIGYVDDIKRVRFWDISRNEYRDRVYHDLKVNRAVLWHRPIYNLFEDMKKLPVVEILDKYFISGTNLNMISPFFYSHLLENQFKDNLKIDIIDIRSTPFKKNESLVYIKAAEHFTPKKGHENHKFVIPSGYEAEYLFMVVQQGNQYRVNRVIPFEYVADSGKLEKIKFPEELRLYQNIGNWQSSFDIAEVFLPEFLAQQISRRATALLFTDERITNTLGKVKPEFSYEKPKAPAGSQQAPGRFVFSTLPPEKEVLPVLETAQQAKAPEDISYYLHKTLQLVGKVIHSYDFKDFSGIQVHVPFTETSFFLSPGDLEQLRKNKLNVDSLIIAAK